jgi:hypothetical protein
MPFIEEQDLIYLHKQIESEIEERNKIETKFRNKSFQLEDTKRKTKMYQVLAAIFALGLIGSIGYFMQKSTVKTVAELTPQEIEVKANKYLEEQGLAAIPQDSLDNLTEMAFKLEMMDMQSDDVDGESTSDVASTNVDSTLTKTYSEENPFKGYVYSVGIGSMKNNGIKLNSGEFSNFKMFQGNLDVYSIGNFKTYKEATAFKLKVRKYMKIRDAYLVAYKDGEHVSVKDALKQNGK